MEWINGFEIVVIEILQRIGEWFKWPMLAITALGYEEFFVLLLPTLYWCFDQMVGLRVGIMLMLGNVFNTFFKFTFHNARPYWFSETVKAYSNESSFGLPSGHAQISASVWGWLAVEIKRRWFTILAILLIFLIGFSRLFLGVHFLSDVLLGWLLGGLLVWAFSAWHQKIGDWLSQRTIGTKRILVLVSTIVILLLVLGVRWIIMPWEMPALWQERAQGAEPFELDGIITIAGTWMGMLAGFIALTATRGHFLAGKGGWKRLLRFFVGLVGILVLYLGLGQIFPDSQDLISYALRFIRYLLIGLWVSWFGPLAFQKLGLLIFEKKDLKT